MTGVGRQHVTRRVEGRSLPQFAVVLVERGSGWLHTEAGGLQTFAAPALFWLFGNTRHSYGPDESGWDERWALFDGTLVQDFIRLRLAIKAAPLVPLHDLGEMQRLFTMLHSEMLDDTATGQAAAASTLHRIVVRAARQANHQPKTARGSDVQPAIHALRQRATETVDMKGLADEFGMSPASLRRKFVMATGLPPKAFQLRLRLDRAKELLTTSDLSVETVAAAVGFDDPFYFSRLFHDREDCSPSAFRRRHQRG